jgi:hypothetical protein
MVEVIEGINAAIETVKKLIEVNEKVKDADVKMLIADLSIQLAEAKISIAELLDKNRKLQEEIKTLKSEPCEALIFKDDVYFDNNGDGPFCPGCYDGKRQKHRILPVAAPVHRKMGVHQCTVCGKFFTYKG